MIAAGPDVDVMAVPTTSSAFGVTSHGTSSTSIAKPPSRLAEMDISLSSFLATSQSEDAEICLKPVSLTPPPENSLTCTLVPPRCLGLLCITASAINAEADSILSIKSLPRKRKTAI